MPLESILNTAPIICSDPTTEIHILTCKRDLLMMFWNLKSFYFFNRVNYRLFVHTDGSVDSAGIEEIKRHFTGVRVIDLPEANERIASKLKDYPSCRNFREGHKAREYYLKVFDPFFFSESDYYLVFDSDMIFLAIAEKVLDFVKTQIPFYHGGRWGWLKYPVPPGYLKDKGYKPVGNLNAGLLGILRNSNFFNLDFIEKFLNLVEKAPKWLRFDDFNIGGYTGKDEPLFSVLMGNSEHKVLWCGDIPNDGGKLVPPYCKEGTDLPYYVGGNFNPLCTMHHFAGPKEDFIKAIEHLTASGFLKGLNS